MSEGKYIYLIISETENKSFGPIGINNREVKLAHYKDIAAVVSDTPVINFDRLDEKELTKHVAIHQKVNEQVMKDYDVCPMAFGIIAPNADEVLRILERAYLQFKTALKKAEGKVEFAVQVRWEQKKLLEELTNTIPEIQKLKQEMSLKSSILGMPIKLKIGKLIYEKVENQRVAYIKDVREELDSLSYDFTLNKLTEDDMIANFSFLIKRAKEPELDRKMQELGEKYGDKLKFKYIGPMPPYSFVNINLSLGNSAVVNEARKLLGLGKEASLDEIKKAYYALSHKYHPDKYGGESETAEIMKKIVEAYSILENYCQSYDDFRGKTEEQKYSFKKEDVENSLIIIDK